MGRSLWRTSKFLTHKRPFTTPHSYSHLLEERLRFCCSLQLLQKSILDGMGQKGKRRYEAVRYVCFTSNSLHSLSNVPAELVTHYRQPFTSLDSAALTLFHDPHTLRIPLAPLQI